MTWHKIKPREIPTDLKCPERGSEPNKVDKIVIAVHGLALTYFPSREIPVYAVCRECHAEFVWKDEV